jgi:hypothetical protein
MTWLFTLWAHERRLGRSAGGTLFSSFSSFSAVFFFLFLFLVVRLVRGGVGFWVDWGAAEFAVICDVLVRGGERSRRVAGADAERGRHCGLPHLFAGLEHW